MSDDNQLLFVLLCCISCLTTFTCERRMAPLRLILVYIRKVHCCRLNRCLHPSAMAETSGSKAQWTRACTRYESANVLCGFAWTVSWRCPSPMGVSNLTPGCRRMCTSPAGTCRGVSIWIPPEVRFHCFQVPACIFPCIFQGVEVTIDSQAPRLLPLGFPPVPLDPGVFLHACLYVSRRLWIHPAGRIL